MYCPVVIISPPFSFEIKGKHRRNGASVPQHCFTLLDRCKSSAMDTNNVVGKLGFMRTFSYDQYPKFVSHIVTKNVTQVGATECKTRVIVCKHNYNLLRPARSPDCFASFVVVV